MKNKKSLQKTCGYIFFIKSIIMIAAAIILIFGGIVLICGSKFGISSPPSDDPTQNVVGNCAAAFVATLMTALGIIFVVVAVILGIFSIVYLLNSRKMIRSTNFEKKSVVSLLIFEIIQLLISLGLMIYELIRKETLLVFLFMIIFIQCFITSFLLIRLIEKRKLYFNQETN